MHPQRKILITYASRLGSTAEVAINIGEALVDHNTAVDVKWIGDVRGVDGYDAVIIGSAIRYDKWLAEATEFVKRHQRALQNTPVSLFFTCLTLSSTSAKARQQAEGYATKIAANVPQVSIASVGQFAGVLDYSKMRFPSRVIARIIFAFLHVKEGDYRDWVAIRAWAKTHAIPPLTPHHSEKEGYSS